MNPPKWFSVALLTAIAIMTGCQDNRVSSLEQRVTRLEQTINNLQSEQKKKTDDDSQRRFDLEVCIAAANEEFDRNLKANGTKSGRTSYSVPVPVLAEMRRQKQDKIEECKLLHGK